MFFVKYFPEKKGNKKGKKKKGGNHSKSKPAITLSNCLECVTGKWEVKGNYLCYSFLSSYQKVCCKIKAPEQSISQRPVFNLRKLYVT